MPRSRIVAQCDSLYRSDLHVGVEADYSKQASGSPTSSRQTLETETLGVDPSVRILPLHGLN